jgi:hypothetical protein
MTPSAHAVSQYATTTDDLITTRIRTDGSFRVRKSTVLITAER